MIWSLDESSISPPNLSLSLSLFLRNENPPCNGMQTPRGTWLAARFPFTPSRLPPSSLDPAENRGRGSESGRVDVGKLQNAVLLSIGLVFQIRRFRILHATTEYGRPDGRTDGGAYTSCAIDQPRRVCGSFPSWPKSVQLHRYRTLQLLSDEWKKRKREKKKAWEKKRKKMRERERERRRAMGDERTGKGERNKKLTDPRKNEKNRKR